MALGYSQQTWTDGTTPVDAAHMSHIEAGVGLMDSGKVDVNAVTVAATPVFQNKLLAGDTQPSFQLNGDGRHNWGPGGATATDTNLYRYFGGALRTDGGLYVGTSVVALGTGGNTGFLSQPAVASGYAFMTQVSGEANARWRVRNLDGFMEWGPGGATPTDTNLYRLSAGVLNTDQTLAARSYGVAVGNAGSQMKRVQGGTVAGTTDGSGYLQANFPVAFSAVPDVVIAINGNNTQQAFVCDTSSSQITSSYVRFRAIGVIGGSWSVIANTAITIDWFAIGNL
jgi:hypothetical protein